jgi:uncharacterized protein (DUF302 family)
MATDGLIARRSNHGPEETMNRLEARVRSSGMEVMAHIDHAAGAARAGLLLRPTDLLIFGAPALARRSCRLTRPSASTCR